MESSYTFSLFFKHIFLVVSIMLISLAFQGYLVEDSITINGEPGELSLGGFILISLLGLLFALLWNYIRQRLIRVRLGGQRITILRTEEKIVLWTEVEALKRILFVSPPLYKIRFKEGGRTHLFLTNSFYLDFGFGAYDMTKMGRLIRKKKKELNL